MAVELVVEDLHGLLLPTPHPVPACVRPLLLHLGRVPLLFLAEDPPVADVAVVKVPFWNCLHLPAAAEYIPDTPGLLLGVYLRYCEFLLVLSGVGVEDGVGLAGVVVLLGFDGEGQYFFSFLAEVDGFLYGVVLMELILFYLRPLLNHQYFYCY